MNYKELTGGCILNSDKTIWDYSAVCAVGATEYPITYRLWSPCIYNQQSKSTCVAHALTTMKQIQDYYDTKANIRYSTSFIYLLREGGQYDGEGMMITEALQNLRKKGVVPYNMFPDNLDLKESEAVKNANANSAELLTEAQKHKIANYASANAANEIKQSLYINHSPVPIGVDVRESFYNTKNNGIVLIPKFTEKSYGGHCMLIIGWTNISGKEYWVVQNSWGENWGDNGYCYLEIDKFPIYEKYIVFDVADYPINLKDIQGRWSEEAITLCARCGIISGYPDNTFKPDKPVTREELAVVVTKLLERI